MSPDGEEEIRQCDMGQECDAGPLYTWDDNAVQWKGWMCSQPPELKKMELPVNAKILIQRKNCLFELTVYELTEPSCKPVCVLFCSCPIFKLLWNPPFFSVPNYLAVPSSLLLVQQLFVVLVVLVCTSRAAVILLQVFHGDNFLFCFTHSPMHSVLCCFRFFISLTPYVMQGLIFAPTGRSQAGPSDGADVQTSVHDVRVHCDQGWRDPSDRRTEDHLVRKYRDAQIFHIAHSHSQFTPYIFHDNPRKKIPQNKCSVGLRLKTKN